MTKISKTKLNSVIKQSSGGWFCSCIQFSIWWLYLMILCQFWCRTPARTLDDSCRPVHCVYPCTAECLSRSTSPGNDAAGWARRSSGSYSRCDTATPGRSCAQRNVNQVWAAPRWCQIKFQLRGCSRLSSKLLTFLPSAGQTSLRCVINSALCVHTAEIGHDSHTLWATTVSWVWLSQVQMLYLLNRPWIGFLRFSI